jgi:hypothetical protein
VIKRERENLCDVIEIIYRVTTTRTSLSMRGVSSDDRYANTDKKTL